MFLGFYPAVLISYDAANRIGEVTIEGLTNGADRGLDATFAYPVGESDLDTELKIDAVALPAPVWVFFEAGDPSVPVISAWRGHQDGTALVDTRRIRQKNIELLADRKITLQANNIQVIGETKVTGNADVTGNLTVGTGRTVVVPTISGILLNFVKGVLIDE